MIFDSDFSYLEGSKCYCSDECSDQIRSLIEKVPYAGIHLLGTGDYHYQSLFWLEKVDRDFALVLFDQHPDDQPGAFDGDLLSCGSWVARARELEHCCKVYWINGRGELSSAVASELPLYLSIDLDVLDRRHAVTNWDQGSLSLERLLEMLAVLTAEHTIIGVDICGGITESQGGTEADFALNRRTIDAIISLLTSAQAISH